MINEQEWPDKFIAEFGETPIVHNHYGGAVKEYEFRGRMTRAEDEDEQEEAIQGLFNDALRRRQEAN